MFERARVIEEITSAKVGDRGQGKHNHVVQFYEDDAFLAEVVAGFLADGLKDGEPALVIATEPHRLAFREALSARGIDVAAAGEAKRLTLLDAGEMLARFMAGGMPDWRRFKEAVGGLIEETAAGARGARVRAYGEMVDLLWKDGNPQAAIRLEELWNDLGKPHSFSLLCAYTMASFYKEADGAHLRQICAAHTHVLPAESYQSKTDPDAQRREIVLLQQRARALESEVRRRMELENALRQALLDVRRSEEALRRSEESLRQADRRKDEFMAVLGHELRNPLAPVFTALQLMKLRGDASAEREREIIERQLRHMAKLVDDLLDVSRVTRGTIALKTEPVELSAVVARAVEMASPLFEDRRHNLKVSIAGRGLMVQADPSRLAQVISNLLTNAAKYTLPGGDVEVKAARERDTIGLTVKDTGVGISSELLQRIFDPFVQEEQTNDRATGGLGLGLAIAHSLVGLHGGTIAAASEGRGKGSTFTVRLPALLAQERAEASSPEARSPRRARPVTGKRVLVVDDNADAADLLAQGIRMFGHDVELAHDGPSALEIAGVFTPDVVVMDIGLPVMDGYELAEQLRKRRSAAGGSPLRLVAVTGYGHEADRNRSAAAGIDAHLVKPVDLDVLMAALGADQPAGGPAG